MPHGLRFSATTRTLSGTPAVPQAATIYTLTATDALGDSATLRFRMTVAGTGGEWVFTDPVLTAGAPVRAVHFTELRDTVNAARTQCGLAGAAWTDPVLTPGVTPVKAAHLAELRAGLAAACTMCGLTPVPTYPDAGRAGTPIRAAHVMQLRAAASRALGNRPPRTQGVIPDQSLAPDGGASRLNVVGYFRDPDGDPLGYTAHSSRLEVVTVGVSGGWVTLAPGAEGTATVTVTAHDPAGLTAALSFRVTVVYVDPSRCPATLTPRSISVGRLGTTLRPPLTVTVTIPADCGWTAGSNASFMSIVAGERGRGPGTVRFRVGANLGCRRSGTLTIANETVWVRQKACCSFADDVPTPRYGEGAATSTGMSDGDMEA